MYICINKHEILKTDCMGRDGGAPGCPAHLRGTPLTRGILAPNIPNYNDYHYHYYYHHYYSYYY